LHRKQVKNIRSKGDDLCDQRNSAYDFDVSRFALFTFYGVITEEY